MFSAHTQLETFEIQHVTITGHLSLCLRKTRRSVAALVSCYCLLIVAAVIVLGLGALFLLFVVLFTLRVSSHSCETLRQLLHHPKLGQGNHMIIVTSSFSKNSVFKMFSVHTKTQTRRFQIRPV